MPGQAESGPRRQIFCGIIRPKPRDGNLLYFLPFSAPSSFSTGIYQRRVTMGTCECEEQSVLVPVAQPSNTGYAHTALQVVPAQPG